MLPIDYKLFEIFVPTHYRNGKEIPIDIHQEWDLTVSKVAGGLSILHPIKGAYYSKDPIEADFLLVHEGMIPVRIATSVEIMKWILEYTANHYDQESVMAYKVSDQVLFYDRK